VEEEDEDFAGDLFMSAVGRGGDRALREDSPV
jgi:hypothetical protein